MADKDKDQTPAAPPERVVTAEEAMQNRQRRAAQEAAAAGGGKLDETVPGGRYRTDTGDLVDANGKPLGKEG